MAAKPQQMSGQPDTSDDLIAELAKLMASNAKADTSEASSTADATASPSTSPNGSEARPSVRIPGMDMPPLTVAPSVPRPPAVESKPMPAEAHPGPAAPAIRIPGMDQPAFEEPAIQSASSPSPARHEPSVERQDPGVESRNIEPVIEPEAQVVPRREPVSAPVSRPSEPVAPRVMEPRTAAPASPAPIRFEPRVVGASKPLPQAQASQPQPQPQASTPEPAIQAQVPPPAAPQPQQQFQAIQPAPLPPRKPVPSPEAFMAAMSRIDTAPRPQPAARPATPDADFDFGFGTAATAADAGAQSGDGAAPKHNGQDSGPAYDPIADIIAAELDEAERAPVRPAVKPNPVETAAPRPAPAPVRPEAASAAPAQRLAPAAPFTLKPGSFFGRQKAAQSDALFVTPTFTPAANSAANETGTVAANSPADPMDEIESLIGQAVRVELGAERPAAAPAMPVMTSEIGMPRPAAIARPAATTTPQSAEAAILAAAAATGADVERIGEVDVSEPAPTRRQAKPARGRPASGASQFAGLAVAGMLLVAAGLGLYWVLGMNRTGTTDAPVLTADSSPVKEVPAATTAVAEPASPVLQQMDGVTTAPADEALAATDSSDAVTETTPVATAETTESGLANRKVRTVTVRPDGTIVSSDDAVAGAEALPVERPNVPAVPGETVNASDLLTAAANTVASDPISQVIADNTAAGDTDVAAAEPNALVAADPAAPVTAAADPVPTTEVAAVDPAAATSAVAEPATTEPAATEIAATEPVTTDPAVTEPAATEVAMVAPVPQPRPSNRAALNGQPSASVTAEIAEVNQPVTVATETVIAQPAVAATQPVVAATQPVLSTAITGDGKPIDLLAQQPQVASVEATPAAAATTTSAADPSGFYVQLSSQKSEADAQRSVQASVARWGSLFGARQLEIHAANLGIKGTYYRVRLPTASRDESISICEQIKASGGDCFVP